jgi:hypothetical protein
LCLGQPGPQSSYFLLPTITGMTGACDQAQISLSPLPILGWGQANILPRLAWSHSFPDFSLSHSLGWQAHTTTSSYWLRMGQENVLPRMAQNCNPPNFSLPRS